jgi:hypothetical protein
VFRAEPTAVAGDAASELEPLKGARFRSGRRASLDLYRSRERELRALEDAFPAVPGQCGAFFGLGDDMCIDVVSRPDAFARLWPKLRAGYLLNALGRLDGKPTPFAVVPTFRAWVNSADAGRQPSVGLGEDVRLRGERVIGSGLGARRRADPAVGVHEPGRRAARVRTDCAPAGADVDARNEEGATS